MAKRFATVGVVNRGAFESKSEDGLGIHYLVQRT